MQHFAPPHKAFSHDQYAISVIDRPGRHSPGDLEITLSTSEVDNCSTPLFRSRVNRATSVSLACSDCTAQKLNCTSTLKFRGFL
jgi:hypothetical protein